MIDQAGYAGPAAIILAEEVKRGKEIGEGVAGFSLLQ
jgi:hypothetical protein